MEWEALPGMFPTTDEPERWLPLLRSHFEMVYEAEARTRVTAVPREEAVQRHYAESLETWRIATGKLDRQPGRVVDVGSGGGFPGLVMACVASHTRLELVEPLKKRARLLEEFVARLGLQNVSVHGERAEDAGRGPLRETADIVTARAVATLPELLEYTAPFAKTGGLIALPKGSGLDEELAAASRAMEELGCRFMGREAMRAEVSETLAVAVFEKVSPTPVIYPRRPGLPGKRPL